MKDLQICPDCSGAGGDSNTFTCATCDGKGGIPMTTSKPDLLLVIQSDRDKLVHSLRDEIAFYRARPHWCDERKINR